MNQGKEDIKERFKGLRGAIFRRVCGFFEEM